MSDEQALLAAILADPANDRPRIVYADNVIESTHPAASRYLAAGHFTTPCEGVMHAQGTGPAHWRSPERAIFDSMIRRCYAKTATNYRRYGGRGITVCDRWKGHFKTFLADVGPRPSPSHTLERKDNDGPYSPENCLWATKQRQARNRSTNRILEHDGRRLTLCEWAEVTGISRAAIEGRLNKLGWSVADALTRPTMTRPECGVRGNDRRYGRA